MSTYPIPVFRVDEALLDAAADLVLQRAIVHLVVAVESVKLVVAIPLRIDSLADILEDLAGDAAPMPPLPTSRVAGDLDPSAKSDFALGDLGFPEFADGVLTHGPGIGRNF